MGFVESAGWVGCVVVPILLYYLMGLVETIGVRELRNCVRFPRSPWKEAAAKEGDELLNILRPRCIWGNCWSCMRTHSRVLSGNEIWSFRDNMYNESVCLETGH